MMDSNLPAIAGGEAAKKTPFATANRYGKEELQELKEALEQGSLFYAGGKKVAALEAAICEMIGVKHAVVTSSGTASIHAACIAAGVSPGDEVITTPITDMGTIVPILYQGGVPVFADLDPVTYNIDPASVEAAITEKTVAIIAVHLTGNACDLDALQTIAEEHRLCLIEDCAQAWGCAYDGRPVGSHGAIGCFSFNEFKHIACGDGGVVVTNDAETARRLRWATDKGYNREPDALQRDPHFLANNYRMTELQAAVGLAQCRKLPGIVEKRRAWAEALTAKINDLPGLRLPVAAAKAEQSYWFYMMRVQPEALGADATEFAEALTKEGLPAGAHYIQRPIYAFPLLTEHSLFKHGAHPSDGYDYKMGLCPESEAILDTCVILPIKETYSDTDLEETVTAIRRVVQWFAAR
jgi:perosamine synthetase